MEKSTCMPRDLKSSASLSSAFCRLPIWIFSEIRPFTEALNFSRPSLAILSASPSLSSSFSGASRQVIRLTSRSFIKRVRECPRLSWASKANRFLSFATASSSTMAACSFNCAWEYILAFCMETPAWPARMLTISRSSSLKRPFTRLLSR
ncbi:hypothetical protein SDC9_196959 [bioreactor metagenome]|uniref:Uncharacterized protein n=1 Tax=bioreactor metagenome TaxID=1076179 RepID=A0A645IDC7_9ZZZZ